MMRIYTYYIVYLQICLHTFIVGHCFSCSCISVSRGFYSHHLRQILLREGGLYVDLDFVCLGVFDGLHRRYDFYSGLSGTATFELNNGLIG